MSSDRNHQSDSISFSIHRAYAAMLFLSMMLLTWLFFGNREGLELYQMLIANDPDFEGFLTHQLFHISGLHLCVNMLVILVAGGILESYWGTPRFLIFSLIVGFGAGLTALVTGVLAGSAGLFEEVGPKTYGASALALGYLTCMAVAFSRSYFLRGVTARQAVIAGLFLGAAGLAFLDFSAARSGEESLSGTFLMPQTSAVGWALLFLWVEPKVRAYRSERQEKRTLKDKWEIRAMRQRVDQLLDKINSGGYDSLTSGEKVFLRNASKHYRQDEE